MVCPGLGRFIGNLSSLPFVEDLGNGIEVEPFVPDVLEQMGGEHGFGDAPCGISPQYFPWLRARAVKSAVPS